MELSKYEEITNFSSRTEIERVELIAYYNYIQGKKTFKLNDVLSTLYDSGHPISNVSRLKNNLSKSRSFRKISEGEYLLLPKAREKWEGSITGLEYDENQIEYENELLDEKLFCGKRGFLDKLIQQINHCYEAHCYDACAVCMRRVFEITLILAYEKLGIQDEIKKDGEYMMLERIVANAINNKTLGLSRLKKEYDLIREIGNYAAHRILYNTRKKDIDDIKQIFRVCLEELYYKAGLLI